MKKNVFGRQFKRDKNERTALFKNLLTSLVVNEKIVTSEAKAKAIKAAADKLITKAKKGGNEAYRALEAEVNHNAVVKLIDDLAGRFAARNGGYTRIVKMGRRVADNAPMAVIEWVEKAPARIATQSVAGGAASKKEAKKKEVSSTADVKDKKKVEKRTEVKQAAPKKVERKAVKSPASKKK